ncbi:MAG: hypothetical protein JWQ48_1382 [Conexibacter sp.]|nr:hypothetical protein [Conexibacter sp.]
MSRPLPLSYVLPLRMADDAQRVELAAYLQRLVGWCADVIVVDGSRRDLFDGNARAWPAGVRHVPPDPAQRCLMGKVAGVRTGIELARCEHVVIADDDVRYGRGELARVDALLGLHDLVRPQNVFDALPWHARWDTARTLLNRSLGADYPGTLGIRRSRYDAIGGYDGDVMFENLELIRTVEADGGRTIAPLDLYVPRRPPAGAHFWGQRVRQAYDDFALPARMACWLAIVPLSAVAVARRRPRPVALAAAAGVALAERGRRRGGGAAVFPASSSLLAPVWVAERGVCAWLALLQRIRLGGVRYGDSVIPTAAHTPRELRRRRAAGAARTVRAVREPRDDASAPAVAATEAQSSTAAARSAPLSA